VESTAQTTTATPPQTISAEKQSAATSKATISSRTRPVEAVTVVRSAVEASETLVTLETSAEATTATAVTAAISTAAATAEAAMASAKESGRLIYISGDFSLSLFAFLKTFVPALFFLLLGVVFLYLSSISDAGISMAQRNAGIVVIALAVLQMIFSAFLSRLDAKRLQKIPNSETLDLVAQAT